MDRKRRLKLKKFFSRSKKKVFLLLLFLFLILGAREGIYFFSQQWNGEDQVNLLVEGEDKFLLVVADPRRRAVFWVSFPGELLIDAFGGYGQFKLKNLRGLAKQEKKPDLLDKSIEYFFGFPLDFWLKSNSLDKEDLSEDNHSRFLTPLLRREVFSLRGGGLSRRINLFLLYKFFSRRDLLWQGKEGEKSDLISQKKRGEGEVFWRLEKEKWDQWAALYLADSALKEEGLGLALYNTTGTVGLARETARVLTSAGIWVVKVGNKEKKVDRCLLGVKRKEMLKTTTLARLRKLTACPVRVLPQSEFNDFADVNLYLGKGFLDELKKE